MIKDIKKLILSFAGYKGIFDGDTLITVRHPCKYILLFDKNENRVYDVPCRTQ